MIGNIDRELKAVISAELDLMSMQQTYQTVLKKTEVNQEFTWVCDKFSAVADRDAAVLIPEIYSIFDDFERAVVNNDNLSEKEASEQLFLLSTMLKMMQVEEREVQIAKNNRALAAVD